MIKKLLVLNGTEGHKFIVGKEYANTEDIQIVVNIVEKMGLHDREYFVNFENGEHVIIRSNNVMVFYSK